MNLPAMNKTVIALCWLSISLSGCAPPHSSNSGYEYTINLNEIDGDELLVELSFSGNLADTSYFCLPKIVPGIYDALNYGKFITDLQASDNNGRALKVNRADINCWEITAATSIATVKYKVNDGWENFDFQGIRPYRSSESHFDSSVVILNSNAVLGYFLDNEHLPFRIRVKKPESFYGATSLTKTKSTEFEDEYVAPDYRTLVDSPMMYAPP